MPPSKLRVAICGGGISGLCLAVALSRYDKIQVDLFEATDRFKEIGAGIMIWSRTWKILERMGLAPELSRVAHSPPDGSIGIGFDFRRSDSPESGERFLLMKMPYGCIRFHRSHFLDVFVNCLAPGVAHFRKRLLSYSQSPDGSITLRFADGCSADCDLLVGCDGIKSTIRSQLFTERAASEERPELLQYIDPVWTGILAYRGLIPAEAVPVNDDNTPHRAIMSPMMYCGKSKHVVSYSISQGNLINVVTFASRSELYGSIHPEPWVTECSLDELLDVYNEWEPEVVSLLKCVQTPTRWAIHHIKPLPFYHYDRVVLSGDSAHAMCPHQGAGAGQAIEDAYILAHLLARCSLMTLPAALSSYESIRKPFANSVLQGSYESGKMYEFQSNFGDDYASLGPAIVRQWDWIERTSPEEELDRAIRHFELLASSL